jgi:hypothetical protein
MTKSDPLPSAGKRHPIFARVFAKAARPWTPKAPSSTAAPSSPA